MDIILTTNSPGEVSAWVKPLVAAFKREWPNGKIKVIIPPCTFASGREVPVVESFPEVDQVIGPGKYLQYALLRKKPKGFHADQEGFVLFLGGDIGHAVMLGKRLHLPVYVYTERDAGHPEDVRCFFVPSSKIADRLEKKGIPTKKIQIVGDLMLEAVKPTLTPDETRRLLGVRPGDKVINLFPGSRPHEVEVTLPLFLEAMALLKKDLKEIKVVITLAPFIDLHTLNKVLTKSGKISFELRSLQKELSELVVNEERFSIYQGTSYNTMQISKLAVSLPGTNNVELAAMETPALVVMPLNWPELIPLPGVAGLIGCVPILGPCLKRYVIIPKLVAKFPIVSPVNRALSKKIFPELIGVLKVEDVYRKIIDVLQNELVEIKEKLHEEKKEAKAAKQIISLICDDLPAFLENKHE